VINHRRTNFKTAQSAFSLIEMVVVIAILVTLLTAGVGLLSNTGAQSRRTGTDLLTGMIEQARTKAITSRTTVALAIAEPGTIVGQDERCRIGLFAIAEEDWPDQTTTPLTVKGVLLSQWRTLNTGIALIPGAVDRIANPLDLQKSTMNYGGNRNLSAVVHLIAFHPRGGLRYPTGSAPVALRIAEGAYRNGIPTPNSRVDRKNENRLKIGRVSGRPYLIE
jgi:prepilin-type N-terminal cleavage/methylation domain-containing protein